jgi:hypothetical protein
MRNKIFIMVGIIMSIIFLVTFQISSQTSYDLELLISGLNSIYDYKK